MQLFHYTGAEMLRGIGKCGITVGDVPTNLSTMSGKIGVWLTTAENADGHGLEESAVDKKRIRLAVDIPPSPQLARWADWAPSNVTADTRSALERAGGEAAETWWVYFGWVKPEWIISAYDIHADAYLLDWPTAFPEEMSRPGVPYWRRDAWQKRMLKDVQKAMARRRR